MHFKILENFDSHTFILKNKFMGLFMKEFLIFGL